MQKFIVKRNYYLDRDIVGYYHCDYLGYQKTGNPDYLNHLKNNSGKYNELDLIDDYIKVYEVVMSDISKIISDGQQYSLCVIPRSKALNKYLPSQLMFRKAIDNIASNFEVDNAIEAIKRIKDTKTTHNWNFENNKGKAPYKGITCDTCEFKKNLIVNKNIILIDDIYTKDVNVIEDCAQMLFELGAKSVTIYVVAKTR